MAGGAGRRAGRRAGSRCVTLVRVSDNSSGLLADVDALVGEWLTVPEAADEMGVSITEIRRLLSDEQLVAVRRGQPRVLSIPAALVRPAPIAAFAGTWTLLKDCGFDDLEALRWLFTEADGASPIALLQAGHKAPVRRRAQILLL